MDKIYSRFNLTSFKKAAISAFLLGDLLLFFSIFRTFVSPQKYNRMVDLMLQINPHYREGFNSQVNAQLFILYKNALIFLLSVAFLYHLFVHFLWFRGSFMARGYLNFYGWSGGILIMIWALSLLSSNIQFALIYLLVSLLFLFSAVGMGYFPEKNPKKSKLQKKSVR